MVIARCAPHDPSDIAEAVPHTRHDLGKPPKGRFMDTRDFWRQSVYSISMTSAMLVGLCATFGGCADRMALDGNLNGNVATSLDGQLATTVKVEGPLQLQVQIQGPTIKYEGTNISDELFGIIKVGVTADDWLLAVFGEPDARSTLRDGSEIWRWTYRPVEQQGSMVQVFNKTEKEPQLATRNVFVQLRNRLVIEKWKG